MTSTASVDGRTLPANSETLKRYQTLGVHLLGESQGSRTRGAVGAVGALLIPSAIGVARLPGVPLNNSEKLLLVGDNSFGAPGITYQLDAAYQSDPSIGNAIRPNVGLELIQIHDDFSGSPSDVIWDGTAWWVIEADKVTRVRPGDAVTSASIAKNQLSTNAGNFRAVYFNGFLYVTNEVETGALALRWIKVDDETISFAGSLALGGLAGGRGITIEHGETSGFTPTLWVATTLTSVGIVKIDVSNPAAPSIVGNLATANPLVGCAIPEDLALDIVYATDTLGNFLQFDTQQSPNIAPTLNSTTASNLNGSASHALIYDDNGSFLWMSDGSSGTQIERRNASNLTIPMNVDLGAGAECRSFARFGDEIWCASDGSVGSAGDIAKGRVVRVDAAAVAINDYLGGIFLAVSRPGAPLIESGAGPTIPKLQVAHNAVLQATEIDFQPIHAGSENRTGTEGIDVLELIPLADGSFLHSLAPPLGGVHDDLTLFNAGVGGPIFLVNFSASASEGHFVFNLQQAGHIHVLDSGQSIRLRYAQKTPFGDVWLVEGGSHHDLSMPFAENLSADSSTLKLGMINRITTAAGAIGVVFPPGVTNAYIGLVNESVGDDNLMTLSGDGGEEIEDPFNVSTQNAAPGQSGSVSFSPGAKFFAIWQFAVSTWVLRHFPSYGHVPSRRIETIAANTNNFDPANLSRVMSAAGRFDLKVTVTGADRNFTGIAPHNAREGKILSIWNVGSSDNLVVPSESGSSSVANRFVNSSGTVTIAPNGVATWYRDAAADGGNGRWRHVSGGIPPAGGGGGLTMIAQISISFTAKIGERQLFDPSPTGRTVSGPASGMTIGQEFAVNVNGDFVTEWTVAKGSQAASIQNPATMLFVASFTIDVGAVDLHYAFDGAKLVLV